LLLTISNQNIFLQTKSLKNRTKQDKTTQYRTIYHFFPKYRKYRTCGRPEIIFS